MGFCCRWLLWLPLRGRVSWGKEGQEVGFATCVPFQKEGSREQGGSSNWVQI